MKKLVFAMFALLAIGFTSCNNFVPEDKQTQDTTTCVVDSVNGDSIVMDTTVRPVIETVDTTMVAPSETVQK